MPETIMERAGRCDDEDAFWTRRIEVGFAIPVLMTQDQQRRLYDLIDEITRAPYNQPVGHVHWLFGHGSKPVFSRADLRFLGLPDDSAAPDDGEPTFDADVLHFETSCREDAP